MQLIDVSLRNEIQLRRAAAADRAVIWQMVRSEHLNPLGLDWRRFLLAVSAGGDVAGCVQIKLHGGGTRELASLVVKNEWRGLGLARRLIETICAGQEPPLYLMCRSSLEPLYARFGFRSLGMEEMPGYYRRIYILFRFMRYFMRGSENLSIMVWE